MFEVFEHTADLGIRARAVSLDELFVDAGCGLIAQLANLSTIESVEGKTIVLRSDSLEYLLFDWLSELLFVFEQSRVLLADFDVGIEQCGAEFHLRATCHGEVADAARHELDHEVKAITYHGLMVEQQPGGEWLAEVIVDI